MLMIYFWNNSHTMFVDNDKDQAQDKNNNETDIIVMILQWDTLHSSSYGPVDLLHGKGCHVY